MLPGRRFDSVMENGPVDFDHTPQVHQQLTVHSRHHSPIVTDFTNGGQFMSAPQEFNQE